MNLTTNGTTDRPAGHRPDGRLTLLCLAHAGGSSAAFASLRAALPGIRTVPLELPGHGFRMREPVLDDLSGVLEDLIAQSAAHTGGPYVVLGNSMGAALGHELARHWSALGRPPAALLAVGRNGPTAGRLHPDLHPLAMPEFLAAIRELGGTPPQFFDHPELVELFAPVLRADFTLAETHRPLPGPPLDCPVWVTAGGADPMVSAAGLRDWDHHTTGEVHITRLPGGHFVLDDPAFHAYVADLLSAALPEAAAVLA
ncbi:thioesterase domain-containing protein [Streptomyces sp. NPDC089919]|uniref:thioesterase II family protein n=1 Tax=Streptomyces sp. NPDC089919 TaxID=3155188 RepID=UPI003436AB96